MGEHLERGERPRSFKKWVVLLTILVIVLTAGCVFCFWQYRTALSKQPKSDTQRIADITKRVSDIIQLPDEQPTIATVVDKRKLADEQLAAEAHNGDELLVYAKAKKVLLYRPSTYKVVDMFRVQGKESPAKTTL